MKFKGIMAGGLVIASGGVNCDLLEAGAKLSLRYRLASIFLFFLRFVKIMDPAESNVSIKFLRAKVGSNFSSSSLNFCSKRPLIYETSIFYPDRSFDDNRSKPRRSYLIEKKATAVGRRGMIYRVSHKGVNTSDFHATTLPIFSFFAVDLKYGQTYRRNGFETK